MNDPLVTKKRSVDTSLQSKGRRAPRIAVMVFAALAVAFTLAASTAQGEVLGRWRGRAERPAPNTNTSYAPVVGQPPYFGKALGATYYTWGYFGAKEHWQTWSHMPYYNDHPQWGGRKGY